MKYEASILFTLEEYGFFLFQINPFDMGLLGVFLKFLTSYCSYIFMNELWSLSKKSA